MLDGMSKMNKTKSEMSGKTTSNTKNNDDHDEGDLNDVIFMIDVNGILIDTDKEMSDYKGHYDNADDDGVDNNAKEEMTDNGDTGYTTAMMKVNEQLKKNDQKLQIIAETSPLDKEEKSKLWLATMATTMLHMVMAIPTLI